MTATPSTLARTFARRLSLLLAAIVLSISAASPLAAADATFDAKVLPFLKQHCFTCHGAEKQDARIRYDQMTGFAPAQRELWTMVHEKLTAGEMPPKKQPQPSAAEKQTILAWIEAQQRSLTKGSTRRLNRRELTASLRDLTGLTVDFSLGLPGDGKVAGFDTGADGLQDAADSVDQWMHVSRRAVDAIRFIDPPQGTVYLANVKESKDPRKLLDSWKDQGFTVKGHGIPRPGLGLLMEPRVVGDRETMTYTVPPPADRQGILRIKVLASVIKGFENVPNPRLWVEIGGQDIDYREISDTPEKPIELEYQVQIADLAIQSKGVVISLSNKVETPYAIEGFANEDRSKPEDPKVPEAAALFRPAFDRKALPPEKQPVPYIVLHQVEVEMDHVAAWPPASWQVSGTIQDDPKDARRLLHLWTERAWRRPVKDAEIEPFFVLYEKLRTKEMGFDEALRATFQSVLLSGQFRYMAAPSHADASVAQHAIASRLSFMLVGEPPDKELRALAAAGKMREPAVLDGQVDRLLADPRSSAFTRPFVTQWLELEQPITIAMVHLNQQYFRFARHLKASMRDETIHYIAQLFKENRPAGELIASDWTMMNDILAHHYGYSTISGGELRKTKLRNEDPRGGGILGHAGIQSMLCWMGDNWVIYRGAWVLRHVLNHPPPPAPLEVPELDPAAGGNKGKTFRELLKQHQEDTRCSVCHKNMDPAGFAFQNFDISGRWRDVEYESYARSEIDGKIAWVGVGKTRPVDTAGNLPRGEEFKTWNEFKQAIVKDYSKDVVRGLLKNLMLYGSSRVPDVDTMLEITTIIKEHEGKKYPLRDLMKSVVKSKTFLDH